jgi:hypothetical protein
MSSALVIESFCEHCDLYWSFHSYIIITSLNHGKCFVVSRYLFSHYSHNISASDIHSYLKNFRHKHEPCYFFSHLSTRICDSRIPVAIARAYFLV